MSMLYPNSKYSFVLSILAIVGVASVWILWICNCIKLSVISLDTFIGVIVALLALIFTLAIGFQIINTIEIKGKIADIELRQKRIDENYRNYIKLANNLQAGIDDSSAHLYCAKDENFEAFVSNHSALYFAIMAEQANQMKRIDQLQNILLLPWKKPITDVKQGIEQVKTYSEKIRTTTSYRNCLSQDYEKVISQFREKVRSMGFEIEI